MHPLRPYHPLRSSATAAALAHRRASLRLPPPPRPGKLSAYGISAQTHRIAVQRVGAVPRRHRPPHPSSPLSARTRGLARRLPKAPQAPSRSVRSPCAVKPKPMRLSMNAHATHNLPCRCGGSDRLQRRHHATAHTEGAGELNSPLSLRLCLGMVDLLQGGVVLWWCTCMCVGRGVCVEGGGSPPPSAAPLRRTKTSPCWSLSLSLSARGHWRWRSSSILSQSTPARAICWGPVLENSVMLSERCSGTCRLYTRFLEY